MPPRRKPGAKLRSAAAKAAAAAKAKIKAEEEEKTAVEVTEEAEDVEAGGSELDNTATEGDQSQDPLLSQEEAGVAEDEANISGETPVEEDQAEAEGTEEEFTEVLDETWNDEEATIDEDVNEDEILADEELVDESQEVDEELEEQMDQADEDVLLADDNEQVEEVEEVVDETETVEEGTEEMEVTEVEESGNSKEDKTAEEALFTIDKTPMDIDKVTLKIEEKASKKTPTKKSTAANVQKGKAPNVKASPVKKDSTKSSGADPKKNPDEHERALRGRVLKLSPITIGHLTGSAVAPILRASIGYVIRSADNQRILEIWFHSEEEAEEMFVKFCNFNWKVDNKPTRVIRFNNYRGTDDTLREWDKTLSPFGLYDGRCMFVSNLPADATKAQVMELFSDAINIQLPTDKDGKSEGYAILEFKSRPATQESSKLTVKLGDNELKLHTVGMQKTPRSKAAQEKLDEEMKKIRQQGQNRPPLRGNNMSRADSRSGRQRPGSRFHQGNQRPVQGNQRPGQGNQRPGQGNQRPGQGNRQGNQQNRTGQGRGNANSQGRFSNVTQKRGSAGGRDDSSPVKRGRMDRGSRNQGRMGNSGMMGGRNYSGGNRDLQLRQDMLMAQQAMIAQQMPSQGMSNRSRQGSGGNRRSGNNDIQNIRGELLGQMQRLQQGGLSDPSYLMNLAQRLQQAQGGGFGNF